MCRHSADAVSYGGFVKLHLLIIASSSLHEGADLRLEKPYAHNQSVPQAPNQPRPPRLCCPRAAPRLHPVSSYFITLLTRVSPALAMYRITLSSLNSCAIFHLACPSSPPAYPQSATFLGRLLVDTDRHDGACRVVEARLDRAMVRRCTATSIWWSWQLGVSE